MSGDETPQDPSDFPSSPESVGDTGPPRAPEASSTPPAPPSAPPVGSQTDDPKRPILREMGIGELIDTAIKVFRANWKTLIGIVAIIMVPLSFAQRLLADLVGPDQPNLFDPQPQPVEPSFAPIIITVVFVLIQALFITPLITGAVTKATADAYLKSTPVPMGEVYRFALSRIGSILWATILYGLVVMGGFILLIIPGIYVSIALIFTIPVVILEGVKGGNALSRSRDLARGHWWRIAGSIILTYLMITLVGIILTFPFTLGSFFAGPFDWVLLAIADSISNIIVTPFYTLIIVLLYFDLRIRKEAFDLALMAQEIAQPT